MRHDRRMQKIYRCNFKTYIYILTDLWEKNLCEDPFLRLIQCLLY